MKNNELLIHPDCLLAQGLVYKPCGFECRDFVIEPESKKYGALEFTLNRHRIKFRVGKITPTKIGQFVTLWKRVGAGPIQPYNFDDPIDFFVISVRDRRRFGQFVFPIKKLIEKGVVSSKEKKGKLAIRVYPTWDIPSSKQALKTQAWQCEYFYEIYRDKPIDFPKVLKLFQFVGKECDVLYF